MKHRQMRIRLAVVVLSVFLCACSAPIAPTEPAAPLHTVTGSLSGKTEVWENALYRLEVNGETGEFTVVNKADDVTWYSNPPLRDEDPIAAGKFKMNMSSALAISYANPENGSVSTSNSYTASFRKNGLTVAAIKDGFKATYHFPHEQITISLYVTLTKRGIRCEIPLQEIEETGNYHLYTIDLLPFMGACGAEESGYLFVPDGSGALIEFQNQKQDYDTYEQKLYGRDWTHDITQDKVTTQSARLPVFGISSESGGLLGIIRDGDGRASIMADTAGKRTSYHTVWPSFAVRGIDTYAMGQGSGVNVKVVNVFEETPFPDECLAVEYLPLNQGQSDYTAMAGAYRQYLIEEEGLTKNADTPATLHVEMLGGVMKEKPVFGVPVMKTISLSPYEKAQEIFASLQQTGIQAKLLYTDWSQDAIDGKPQVEAEASGALGGTKALKALCQAIANGGSTLYLGADFSQVQHWANGFRRASSAAKAISQNTAVRYFYDKATFFKESSMEPFYLVAPLRQKEMLTEFLEKSTRWEGAGVLLDTAGDLLYSDYNEDESTSRQRNSEIAQELAQSCLAEGRKLTVRGGNAYVAVCADAIMDAPVQSSAYDLTDAAVPFYSLVFRGYKELSGQAFNLSDSPKAQFLYAVETGISLHVTLGTENLEELAGTKYDSLYSIDYADWAEALEEYAKRLAPLLKATAGQCIVGHQTVSTGVVKTTYENGDTVLVNYTNKPVNVDGIAVEAQDFQWVKEG